MTVLLDTHVVLCAVIEPTRLSTVAQYILAAKEKTILVSAASAWEIARKYRLGRLPGAKRIERDFVKGMNIAGYDLRAITVDDGLRAGRLVGGHQDSFDRMIAAQALADDIPVISADAKLDGFGVRRIW